MFLLLCWHAFPSPQDIRKSISANVHVKTILCKLASELAGGVEDEGRAPTKTIHLHTAEATHKVIQKLEVTVKVSRTSRASTLLCVLGGWAVLVPTAKHRCSDDDIPSSVNKPNPQRNPLCQNITRARNLNANLYSLALMPGLFMCFFSRETFFCAAECWC